MIPQRTRISVDRDLKMFETGVLTEDDRVELIDGDIVNMQGIGPIVSPRALPVIQVTVGTLFT